MLDNGKRGLLAKNNTIEGIAEMITTAYKTHVKPAVFDPVSYNEEVMKMFYSKLV